MGAGAAIGLCAALLASPAWAQAGLIEDPENVPPGGEIIVDPENVPPGGEIIVDPENVPPGGEIIVDPENVTPATAATQPAALPQSRGGPTALFRGTFTSAAAVDVRHESDTEDTVVVANELELRARVRANSRWNVVMEGRLGWWLTGSGPAENPTIFPDDRGWQGRLEPELRDFYVSGRAGRFLLRIGQQSIVWGSTDISKPADVINPMDYRRGFFSSPEDARIPVPAIDVVHAWDRVSWEWLVVPFFVAHEATVYGADGALLSPAGLESFGVPATALATLVPLDPSLEDLAQPLLLQTSLPEEVPQNASIGTRLTARPRGWDLSLGWFYGWDRFPRITLHPSVETLLGAAAEVDPEVLADSPLSVPEIQGVLQAALAGDSLYTATYERRQILEIDGVHYFGPVGMRFESAFSPERTLYLADLRSVRRPSVLSALGLSYERSDGNLIATGEVFYQHVFARSDDGDYVLGTDELLGVAGGLDLSFAAFERSSGIVEDLSVELASFYLPDGRDLVVAPAVAWEITPQLRLRVVATVVESLGDGQTIGDFADAEDAVTLEVRRTF